MAEVMTFSNKQVGTYTKLVKVTEEDINNIMCTAMEGGCNYWMCWDKSDDVWTHKPQDLPSCDWVTLKLLEGKAIPFYDAEEEDEDRWELTLNKLLRGIRLNAKHRPHDCDLENMDAITANCIVQYALFGKLV